MLKAILSQLIKEENHNNSMVDQTPGMMIFLHQNTEVPWLAPPMPQEIRLQV